jgi:Uma2 family endonuclease
MRQAPAGLHRWTRHEYERLLGHGFLHEDDPIELVDGLLLVREPQSSLHRTAILLIARALDDAFGDGWFIQIQSPIILGDRSEPEPDVCVVRGSPRDYVDSHPRLPALVVEVAQTGLALARGRKAAVYARGGIADYWIVNLLDRVVEVHREPARPGPTLRRWGYVSIDALGAAATLVPLASPSARILVADLLP